MIPIDELEAMRDVAEQLMLTTVTITRTTSTGAFDPDTGDYGAGTTTTVWQGPANIRAQGQGNDDETAGQDVHRSQWRAKLPTSSTGIQVDDILTVTSVDERVDPDLAGRSWRISDVQSDAIDIVTVLTLNDDQP